MSAVEFAANLEDPDWMEANVFEKVPVEEVEGLLLDAVDESIEIITDYLNPRK